MSDHRRQVECLGVYVLGLDTESDRRETREHLLSCDECRAEWLRLRDLPFLLSRVGHDEVKRPNPTR